MTDINSWKILNGDALEVLKTLPDESVQMCVTSPPYYGLRDYGVDGQIGLEDSPEQYIDSLVNVFREVKRVLKKDGTLWVNIGDSYAGSGKGRNADGSANVDVNCKNYTSKGTIIGNLHKSNSGCAKPKDLIGIPWMLAFALRADGWYLRQDIIWDKANAMPEPIKDRCVKSHEYIFLLSKSQKYYFDYKAIQERAVSSNKPRVFGANNQIGALINDIENVYAQEYDEFGNSVRNKRDVWSVPVHPFKGAHFATFPEQLVKPCILAGSQKNGLVLDPFNGSGTTGVVCIKNDRDYIGIELNQEYIEIANERIESVQEQVERQKDQYTFF